MQIALDSMDNRISIFDANKKQDYYCPVCREILIQKRGNVNIHHFSHTRSKSCDDWYEDNEWSISWQELFPEEYREAVIRDENESHRADIRINDLILKFQNTTMNGEDFETRYNFFASHGSLIWVVNLLEKDIEEKPLDPTKKTIHYEWKHAYKFNKLDSYNNRRKFNLFFQIEENLLVKVIWNKQGYKYFGGYKYTKKEFFKYLNYNIRTRRMRS